MTVRDDVLAKESVEAGEEGVNGPAGTVTGSGRVARSMVRVGPVTGVVYVTRTGDVAPGAPLGSWASDDGG